MIIAGLLSGLWSFLKGLPWQVWAILAGLAALYGCFLYGQHTVQVKWDVETAANKAQAQVIQTKQATINDKIETENLAAESQIKTVYRDRVVYQTKEVPYEVIIKEDSQCVVPNRVVSMWNSANRGTVPDPASQSDEAASGVKLSDISAEHEREAEAFQLNVNQIKAWQKWAKQQSATLPTSSP